MTALRRLVTLLLVTGLALAGLVLGPTTAAHAEGIDGLCKQAPAPVRPDYQVAGMLMEKPNLKDVPDAAPNPFTDKSVPISDVYGWSWRWTNYDLGCGSDFIRDPNAVVNTSAANFMVAQVDATAASIESLEHMSRDLDLSWLVDVVKTVAAKVQPTVLGTGLPIGIIVVGLLIGFTALRANYAETMRRVLIVAGCIAAAVFTLVFPVTAANQVNSAAQSVANVSQAGFSTRASDLIVRNSLYPTWLAGNFGSADSPVAKEYGPRLMDAQTYTWSDVKRIERDPGAKASIDKAKNTAYTTIATEVQKKDPAAYAAMTGKDDTRTSAALLGAIWVAILGFFVAVAGLIMVLGRLIMLAMVVVTPLATVIGVVRFAVLQRLWDIFAAAVINIAKFTIAAGIMTLLLGGIQAAPVGVGWKLLLTIAVTVIAIMLTKPIKSFKSMAGLNPERSVLRGLLKRAGSAGAGYLVGHGAGERDQPATAASQGAADRTVYARSQPVESYMPALPPPPGAAALGAAPLAAYQLDAAAPRVQRRLGWAGVEALATNGALLPNGSRAPQPALEAAPAEQSSPQVIQPAAAPETPLVRASDDVVYPSGIIVARDQPPLRETNMYRRGRDTQEVYLRLPEPELDANAEQTRGVVYHSAKVRSGGLVGASTQ